MTEHTTKQPGDVAQALRSLIDRINHCLSIGTFDRGEIARWRASIDVAAFDLETIALGRAVDAHPANGAEPVEHVDSPRLDAIAMRLASAHDRLDAHGARLADLEAAVAVIYARLTGQPAATVEVPA